MLVLAGVVGSRRVGRGRLISFRALPAPPASAAHQEAGMSSLPQLQKAPRQRMSSHLSDGTRHGGTANARQHRTRGSSGRSVGGAED